MTVRSLLPVALLVAVVAGPASSERRPEAGDSEATIERVLELRREIERLMSELSPEAQAELERRASELQPATDAVTLEPPVSTEAGSPVQSAPATTSAVQPAAEPAARPDRPGPRCGTLEILDSNGDGSISGADRNWRYLSLWKDDGDGVMEDSELKSLFAHGIRRVSVRLFSYVTAKDVEGGVWVEDAIYFDLPGRRGRAVLAINAGGLARGDRLWLEDGAGVRLDGVQALAAGMSWVGSDGDPVGVLCR